MPRPPEHHHHHDEDDDDAKKALVALLKEIKKMARTLQEVTDALAGVKADVDALAVTVAALREQAKGAVSQDQLDALAGQADALKVAADAAAAL